MQAPKIKIVIGNKAGWTSYSDLDKAKTAAAEAAKTRSNDLLFCFFTSGTTGLPKRVGHTAVSYPVGHLSTSVMTGIQTSDIHHNLSAPGWAKWAWSSFFGPLNVGATATGFNFKALDGAAYLEPLDPQDLGLLCPAHGLADVHQHGYQQIRPFLARQSIGAGEPLNPEVISQVEKTDQYRDP